MENLKSVLADKILEVSSDGGDDIKSKIDKIQRFRDFANACQSLMNKYPSIEAELISMVKNNDFDTKLASSRVDTVIRLADNEHNLNAKIQAEADISKLEAITEQIEAIADDEDNLLQTQDADYELVDEDKNADYAEFEESSNAPSSADEVINVAANTRKENIRKIVQVCGVILIVIVFIFLVKFVLNNWKTILYVLGSAAAIALLIWFLVKRSKKSE